jgi:hypothetical protein
VLEATIRRSLVFFRGCLKVHSKDKLVTLSIATTTIISKRKKREHQRNVLVRKGKKNDENDENLC